MDCRDDVGDKSPCERSSQRWRCLIANAHGPAMLTSSTQAAIMIGVLIALNRNMSGLFTPRAVHSQVELVGRAAKHMPAVSTQERGRPKQLH